MNRGRPKLRRWEVARWAGEARYPNLWRGLVGAWYPTLGASGHVLIDNSHFGHHGVVDSGANWVFDPHGASSGASQGRVLRSSSSGAGATITATPTLNAIDDEMTIAFWLKAAHPGSDFNLFWRMRAGGDGVQLDNRASDTGNFNSKLGIRIQTSAGTSALTSSAFVFQQFSSPHHIAVVLNRGAHRTYIDGVLDNSTGYSHGNGFGNTAPVEWGVLVPNTQFWDMLLYNRALTEQEVRQLYYFRSPLEPRKKFWNVTLPVTGSATLDLPLAGGLFTSGELVDFQVTVSGGVSVDSVDVKIDRGSGFVQLVELTDPNEDDIYTGQSALDG